VLKLQAIKITKFSLVFPGKVSRSEGRDIQKDAIQTLFYHKRSFVEIFFPFLLSDCHILGEINNLLNAFRLKKNHIFPTIVFGQKLSDIWQK
jgi:hypothetical protein